MQGARNCFNCVLVSEAFAEMIKSPPDKPGVWILSCMENDYVKEEIRIYFNSGELWADDPHLGKMSLKCLHEGLTNVSWFESC